MNLSSEARPALPPPVQAVLNQLHGSGYDAYVVGGCLRDCLLGRMPHDWDIATNARPEAVAALFAHVAETGLKHGTLTVIWDRMPMEVTTFRVDGRYSDLRRPDSVTYTDDLARDLARRDFTVNAMAYRPDRPLVDLYGGRDDLAAGIIRCVGDPRARFGEDALRILRAFRFAMRLGFAIEEKTQAAMFALCGQLKHIAAERVTAELMDALGGRCDADLIAIHRPLFAAIWEPWGRVAESDWIAMSKRAARASDAVVRLALLCGGEAPGCLRLDNKTARRLRLLLARRDCPVPVSKPALLFVLSEWGEQGLRDRLAYMAAADGASDAGAALDALLAENPCFALKHLAVDGGGLMARGLPSGPVLGKVLQTLLETVMRGEIANERDRLEEEAVRVYNRMENRKG